MNLRPITHADWPQILDIQLECYPQIEPESLEVLQSKWQASPDSCFVIELDNNIIGYCLAHPWLLDNPPSLEQQLSQIEQANTLYLHDIALSAKAQGKGAGKQALANLINFANSNHFANISLVAVQGAHHYWGKQGFITKAISKDLSAYPADARYMVYTL
ncbi:GNAT family N-acetyltransferase [Shewanella fidelis]|uniref:GNAT family N-acetyltransferase n=1 Tax=Shewanella fidelis TaxID=173509 RepID=A0AAW8NR92_9GAMM|nr:GNAT family N-acetyltransferase [Shewanella fidelis]MDR8524910.1 GNAT family N-acetyltransferase [Shewanella fidelis]MDW4810981.1 GNAT family N-acetyltransferase [Shewanella fidelis]MDW4815240.1 GNAT family N-acetyltransferase [Shewanella fidelis]MDW4819330.1 GNAT family N-acetyltransferase [Shewanella fidelis]MDW4822992.1 GNAT family N-acetyltransferase [Shewanella fidelis]